MTATKKTTGRERTKTVSSARRSCRSIQALVVVEFQNRINCIPERFQSLSRQRDFHASLLVATFLCQQDRRAIAVIFAATENAQCFTMRRFERHCVVPFHRTISRFLKTGLRYAQASTRYAMRAKIGNDVQQGASVEQGLLHDSKESERTPKRAYQLRRKSGESVCDRGDEVYASARGRSSRRIWQFSEFYSVGCTPRNLCCSAANFWDRNERKPHVAL